MRPRIRDLSFLQIALIVALGGLGRGCADIAIDRTLRADDIIVCGHHVEVEHPDPAVTITRTTRRCLYVR